MAGHKAGADDPAGQKEPAGHSTDDVGVGQYRPAAHVSHDCFPGHVTNVPGGHGVGWHMPGRSHLKPIGQSVCDTDSVLGQ